jgi:hypothetical protein
MKKLIALALMGASLLAIPAGASARAYRLPPQLTGAQAERLAERFALTHWSPQQLLPSNLGIQTWTDAWGVSISTAGTTLPACMRRTRYRMVCEIGVEAPFTNPYNGTASNASCVGDVQVDKKGREQLVRPFQNRVPLCSGWY